MSSYPVSLVNDGQIKSVDKINSKYFTRRSNYPPRTFNMRRWHVWIIWRHNYCTIGERS
jgi:hypothetical protein